ncbi:MAG: mercury transporter MerT [Rhodospirillales bacterium 69-11]|jgi:mercuric ion transport protein|nr:mercury transporter MerT [Rhodospirillales bacterium]MBN8928484.1 mercury transporter MerT [Rhodospirillales bacterium]OJW30452.1 MAG: mercury transporter MerT [Rhodospirillales bacterium 69-11]
MGVHVRQDVERLADIAERDGQRRATLLSMGGILAALGAASCCVIPFALFLVGVSGAWIGNLTALEPYQPLFAAVSLGFIGYGAYLVYWKPKLACAAGSYCARPASTRIAKIGLWTAGGLVVIAVGFPYAVRAFLGS